MIMRQSEIAKIFWDFVTALKTLLWELLSLLPLLLASVLGNMGFPLFLWIELTEPRINGWSKWADDILPQERGFGNCGPFLAAGWTEGLQAQCQAHGGAEKATLWNAQWMVRQREEQARWERERQRGDGLGRGVGAGLIFFPDCFWVFHFLVPILPEGYIHSYAWHKQRQNIRLW